MPVNLPSFPNMPAVAGIKLAALNLGAKDKWSLIALDDNSSVSCIFTQNAFCAAPVTLAKQHLTQAKPKYLLINAGNANAGTGKQGIEAASSICAALAAKLGVSTSEIIPFSTGVIGQQLDVTNITANLDQLITQLHPSNWQQVATAIMTTDTAPKGAQWSTSYKGKTINIAGIAKGSGMICPNMATMLGFITTDAAIAQPVLDKLVEEVADLSFNRISVDGDTSTNDAMAVVATGAALDEPLDEQHQLYNEFKQGLLQVCKQLAQAIVRDGEGATKFVTIAVTSAASQSQALEVAYKVAHSPLVKTALFGSDANWGRVLAAVGNAPSVTSVDNIDIFLDDVCVLKQGQLNADYTEAAGAGVLAQDELQITIALNQGAASETVYTSDLSYDYIKINADYRS